MSKWTHLICEKDWNRLHPEKPVHDLGPAPDAEYRCCFCNEVTSSGIYIRFDPAKVGCGGMHVDGT